MRRFGKITMAVVAPVLLWTGLAYVVTAPTSESDYHRTVVQVAEAAHDAARTGALTGRQVLEGKVFGAFATSAFDDSIKAMAGAQKQFAGEPPPPDERSRRWRDQLATLLLPAVLWLGDAASAVDDAALRAAIEHLDPLAEQLHDFIEAI
jgi:hypothetical protein